MQALHRPAVQDTARQVGSGLPFLAFASRRSAQASALFAQRLQTHLQPAALSSATSPGRLTTAASSSANCSPTVPELTFPAAVTSFGSQHERIPPAAHTYQSDVETVHRLIEDEFFDWDLSPAARTSWPRLPRTSSTSTSLVPTLTKKVVPRGRSSSSSPLSLDLCSLRPVFLDYRLDSHGAYDVPRYPNHAGLRCSALRAR